MSQVSRRKILGASLGSTAALVAGKSAAASKSHNQPVTFKTTGAESMSLEEFRTLNGPGSVARLIGEMDCDLLASCHKDMKKNGGVWIPELVPVFQKIDQQARPNTL